MTTRIWIGGGNNKASNPKDWSSTGVPQSGDSLFITGSTGAMPPNGTINIAGNDLAGDTLAAGSIPTHSIVTINLSHDATLRLDTLVQGIVVIPQSTTINVTGDATLTGDTLAPYNTQTINIGHGTLTLNNVSTTGPVIGQSVVINSSGGALKLQGNTNEDANSTIAINAPVKGTGAFVDGGLLTFSDSVARGITVDLTSGMSFLQVDEPKHFLGLVDLTGGQIDLNGLATADSYSFKDDMLKIFAGKTVIDTLRLHDSTQYSFAVEKAAGSVNIVAIADPSNRPVGLPIHA